LKLAIALYLAYSAYDHLIAYGFLMAALSIFLLILRRIYCHRYYAECVLNFRKYYEKDLMKEISSFAGWSFLGSASSMITSYGQGIIINIFFGTAVNAAQGIATQVSGQLGTFSGTMRKALNPVLMKSEGEGNRQLMLRASMMGSKISFFLLMIIVVPVYIEMPFIFNLWLKNVPKYAIIFCQLLLIRNLVEQSYVTLTSTIAAVGNIKGLEVSTAILNCLPLFVSYYFLKLNYPPYSVYVIYIIYCSLFAVIVIYFAKKKCGMSISQFLQNVVCRCICSFAVIYSLALIPTFFMNPSFNRLLGTFIITIFSFLFVVWYVGFSSEERTKLAGYFTNVILKYKNRNI